MTFRFSRNARILVVSMVAAAALAACGGGSDPAPVKVASSNVSKTLNKDSNTDGTMTTLQTVSSGFSFPSGTAELGTTEATTLAIKGTVAAPEFEVKTSANKATGKFSFGSCVFTITATDFPSGPLAAPLTTAELAAGGRVITITPCETGVNTAQKTADGTEQNTTATLKLGATLGSAPVKVVIAQDGTVRVNGSTAPIGQVETKPGTGAN
ncbi:hypothetical protein [Alicycliphilus denitrificans]|uniref:hypothetical protein n=1 Tax=Alicycliphilus denitrificans TaxID=179636 RepID=UPI0038507CFF